MSPVQSVERLADHFVNYLFDTYRGSRHVRRVATWIGFLLKAIENVADGPIRPNRERQIVFSYRGRNFKARYNHKVGARGGIEIVEVLPGRGAPTGGVVLQVTNLSEAEAAYEGLKKQLESFCAGTQ